jgi:hypothetical protein
MIIFCMLQIIFEEKIVMSTSISDATVHQEDGADGKSWRTKAIARP